jgi:hypothetical protein
VFQAGLCDEPEDVGLGEAKGTRALLPVGQELAPLALIQVALDRLADEFGRRAVLLVSGGLDLGEQAGGHKDIGRTLGFHKFQVALRGAGFKEAMISTQYFLASGLRPHLWS